MLGIILGVSSLVAMSALVSGMEKGATEALIAIGGLEKVRVEPQDLPVEQRHLRTKRLASRSMMFRRCSRARRWLHAFTGDASSATRHGQRQDVSPMELRRGLAGGRWK